MDSKKNIDHLIESFVAEERNTPFNPFLSTRVLAAISKKESGRLVVFSPLWKTAVIAASVLVAVFTGIAAGSLYQSKNDRADMVLMNDDSMENFGIYNQIGNE
ncbi:MAG: hypothetical protein ABIU77_15605 [Ferruginibacter sp.]